MTFVGWLAVVIMYFCSSHGLTTPVFTLAGQEVRCCQCKHTGGLVYGRA